jgi:hypothetical protein
LFTFFVPRRFFRAGVARRKFALARAERLILTSGTVDKLDWLREAFSEAHGSLLRSLVDDVASIDEIFYEEAS